MALDGKQPEIAENIRELGFEGDLMNEDESVQETTVASGVADQAEQASSAKPGSAAEPGKVGQDASAGPRKEAGAQGAAVGMNGNQ